MPKYEVTLESEIVNDKIKYTLSIQAQNMEEALEKAVELAKREYDLVGWEKMRLNIKTQSE
jgi:hypothetical protein